MGRENKDGAVVGSSIVLLQERFKQLQRLKEMREEKKLIKLLPQSISDEAAELRKGSLPPLDQQSFHDPLALELNSSVCGQIRCYRVVKPRYHHDQLHSSSAVVGRGHQHNLAETMPADVVDTSLHL